MTIDQVLIELYRLAESKAWDGKTTDEALLAAIDGMERIWEQKQTDKRRSAMARSNKKQYRIWC
jgi:hypothetical protein